MFFLFYNLSNLISFSFLNIDKIFYNNANKIFYNKKIEKNLTYTKK